MTLKTRSVVRHVAAHLIGRINELHTLVSDGEDDGGDFSHLFCRPLEEKMYTGIKDTEVIYCSFIVYVYYVLCLSL